jgi:ActR/RegA family two-component response regulator
MEVSASSTRLLFVDDEPSIRFTIPLILKKHGFDVTATATVKEAISAINSTEFEVLLADLNIGEPGDGFTVVSAMRRMQPNAVCLILTGYPAFETALRAIRDQVDGYLVKPAKIEELVSEINGQLQKRTPRKPIAMKRVATVIDENLDAILAGWLQTTKADPDLGGVSVSDEGRLDHFPELLREIVERNEQPAHIAPDTRTVARKHGTLRRQQKYSLPLMVREARILQESIGACIQSHLLSLELSCVIPDLINVNEVIQTLLEDSLNAYLSD